MSTQAPATLVPEPCSTQIRVTLADDNERETIYRIRHAVYATELGQHPVNEQKKLYDDLDKHNTYILAKIADEIVGFISITPPASSKFSVNKYFSSDELPFRIGPGVFETRLLTVLRPQRRKYIASILMYAAIRWIEAQGGRRVIAMGRREIVRMYSDAGLQPMGRKVRAGAVTYELMAGQIQRLQQGVSRILPKLRNRGIELDWRLDIPLRKTTGCHHGGASFDAIGADFRSLSRVRDVINADVLDAWFPPSPKVTRALQESLPWIIRTSPPADASGLVETVAQTRNIPAECVLPAAGSTSLIFTVFKKWLSPASRVLLLDPTYGEYAHITQQIMGCEVERLTLLQDDHFNLNLTEFESQLRRGYDLVVLVNPNNPTGQYVPGKTLAQALQSAPKHTKIWIDEAYLEYANGARSLEPLAAESNNIFVSKSLSKVYGLSGLRVGYLCGNPRAISEFKADAPPWAVSLPAQIAAVQALEDPEYYKARHQQTRELRAQLMKDLAKLDSRLQLIHGQANFILCFLPKEGPCAETILHRCQKHDLYLRDTSTMGTCLGYHGIRIAVKDQKTNEKIIRILSQVLTTR